jgi:hypothetical protein
MRQGDEAVLHRARLTANRSRLGINDQRQHNAGSTGMPMLDAGGVAHHRASCRSPIGCGAMLDADIRGPVR